MKYIIIGLGNFGATLARKLSEQGHEVIGIDHKMNRVEAVKKDVSHVICMDATDESVVKGLPISTTDIVMVTIGENQGTNVMVTALFKHLEAKKIISRAISPLHEKVLEALGVNDLVRPEMETAERWTKKLTLDNVVDSFQLDPNYSIIEILVPQSCIGKTVVEIDFRHKYDLLVLSTIQKKTSYSLFGGKSTKLEVQGVASADLKFQAEDILVLYGSNKNLNRFIKDHK